MLPELTQISVWCTAQIIFDLHTSLSFLCNVFKVSFLNMLVGTFKNIVHFSFISILFMLLNYKFLLPGFNHFPLFFFFLFLLLLFKYSCLHPPVFLLNFTSLQIFNLNDVTTEIILNWTRAFLSLSRNLYVYK